MKVRIIKNTFPGEGEHLYILKYSDLKKDWDYMIDSYSGDRIHFKVDDIEKAEKWVESKFKHQIIKEFNFK